MSARGSSRSFAGTTPGQVSAAVAAHEADTTNVHGIADTSVLETTTGAQTKATAAQTAAVASSLQKASNLSDLASPSTARTSLGLGGAATMAVGTTTGTVAAGNDARLVSVTGDWLTAGEIIPRRDKITGTAVSMASGSIYLSYFTAVRSETISTLTVWSGATQAAATPTLIRFGIYSVAGNGDLTLVASTPNDTALLAAQNTAYPKALSASWNKGAGTRYAHAVIVVSGATMPSFHGLQLAPTTAMSTVVRLDPAIIGRVTGQTDLLSSISVGSIVGVQAQIAMQMS